MLQTYIVAVYLRHRLINQMNPTATNPLTESIDKNHHGEMCLDLPIVVGTSVSATCESG